MDRLGEVRASEQRVREETFGAFAGEADVLEQALGLSLHVIHGARLTFDHTFLRALLVSRATGSLRCAWLAAAAGYRTQGLTLVRAAFEDYGTAGWVTMQPDDANLWLWEIVDDVPKPDQRPPRFTEIFKRLSEENLDSPDVLNDLYGRLSEAAHPRAPGLLWNAQFGGGDEGAKYSAEFLPVWDNSATATCLHYLLLIAYLILAAAVELRISSLPDDADDTQPLLAESQRVSALILEALGRIHPFVPTADAQTQRKPYSATTARPRWPAAPLC